MKKDAKTVPILLSFTMIVVTVFAILFLSYAWFLREKSAKVTSITFAAASAEGIQLSADAENWKDVLNADEDLDLDNEMYFDSISTSAEVQDGKINFYSGFYTSQGYSTVLLTEENKLFYEFDIYFLNSDRIPKQLTLSNQSSVLDTNDRDVQLSTRVAFVNLGKTTDAQQAKLMDGQGVSSASYIWEPNSTSRNRNIAMYHNSYISEGKSSYKGVSSEVGNSKLEDGLIVNTDENPNHVKSVQTFDPVNAGDKKEILVLEELSITKVRIYIWVEGQDIDCTNSVSGGTADIYLDFNIYDLQKVDDQYIPAEKFNTPTISHVQNVTYSWQAVNTDVAEGKLSQNYLVKVSSLIGGDIIVVRSITTNQTTININDLLPLGAGKFSIQVMALSTSFANSDFSNYLEFTALGSPTQLSLSLNTLNWQPVNNSISYTVKAVNRVTGQELLASVSLISINLSTTLFGGQQLPNGDYYISVRANGGNSFASSAYSTNITFQVT